MATRSFVCPNWTSPEEATEDLLSIAIPVLAMVPCARLWWGCWILVARVSLVLEYAAFSVIAEFPDNWVLGEEFPDQGPVQHGRSSLEGYHAEEFASEFWV